MLFKKTYDIEADSTDTPFAETVIDLTGPNVDPVLPINIIDWLADPSHPQGTGENDFATLTDQDDRFSGGRGNDVVHAGDGNDAVNGGDGNDVIFGGDGYDRLSGDEGNDFIYGGDGGGILRGGDGNDVIRGGDNTDPRGGNIREILYGGEGEDVLAGGAGNDYLYGDQPLWGASVPTSADTFVFDVKNWGRDVIADFDDKDKIQFGGTSGVTSFEDLHIEEFTRKDGSVYTVISYQPAGGNPGDVNEIVLQDIEAGDISPDDFIF